MANILLHLTLSAVGMYITYKAGFRSGVRFGVQSLAGVLNVAYNLRNDNINSSSRREAEQAGPSDSSKS